MKHDKVVYKAREAADIIGVNLYTMHELLREGRINGFKIKTHWRIPADSLDQFMDRDSKETGEE